MRGKNLGKPVIERGAAGGGDCGPWTSASSPPLANCSFPTHGKIRADVLEKNQAGAWGLDKPWDNIGLTALPPPPRHLSQADCQSILSVTPLQTRIHHNPL